MVSSDVCLINPAAAYQPQPRTKLFLRSQGHTGIRRLPFFIDWDELGRLQEYTGMSEYACVRIMGYSLTSFYRHKKLKKADIEKPVTLPKLVDVDLVEQIMISTGKSQRQVIKELGISSTTYFRHKKMRDEGITIRLPRGGRPYIPQTDNHSEEVKKLQIRTGLSYDTCSRWIDHCTKQFYRHRKAKKVKEPKRHWEGVEIDWKAIDDMQRKTWIPGYKWMSRRQCALKLGYKSSTYYRQLKLLHDDTLYDRVHEPHTEKVTIRLQGGFLSMAQTGV